MTDLITIDTDRVFGDDAISQGLKKQAEALHEALLKHISPSEALNLDPLLDKRRLQHGIPDECFSAFVMYEFVHIYQIDIVEGETAGKESRIIRPDAVRDRNLREAHRGIVIGAGLRALDIGVSNGWYLGHVVNFIQLAPYRQRAVTIEGKDWVFLVMRAGDIRSSEDTEQLRREGKLKVVVAKDSQGRPEHQLVWPDGSQYSPMDPYLAEDA